MKIGTLLLTLVLALVADNSQADGRPRVGLVLSGGGARGAAHVGVLKVLEEMQIPIDMITGTSMGSIVGGLYASGLNADEIEDELAAMDWDEVLNDSLGRQHLSLRRKRDEDLFSINLKPGIGSEGLKLPSGAIQGQKIELALQRLTNHVSHISSFDDLVIPFRAVATDIVEGEMVILSEGDLAKTMRASMSVPSLFAPIKIDNRILVDGGVTNNLPVDVALQMGADVLIVVDISTPLHTEDEIKDILSITDQLTRLLTGQNTRASRNSIRRGDILIIPDLGDITSAQFDRSGEAIHKGEDAARTVLDSLSRLSLSAVDYQQYLSQRTVIVSPNQVVSSITIENSSGLEDATIEHRVDIVAGKDLDLDQLETDVQQIYGLGVFEKVSYDLHYHQTGVDVKVLPRVISWGPNYLQFGLKMDGDIEGENSFNVIGGYSRTTMNSLGGEWTTLLQLGEEPRVESFFYQPLGLNQSYFVQPFVSVTRDNVGIYDAGGDKIVEYRAKQSLLELAIGREFGTRATLMAGVSRNDATSEVLIGDPSLPEPDFDDAGMFVNFHYDTLDDVDFPTQGAVTRLSFYRASEGLGADKDYDQWRARLIKVKSFDSHTIIAAAIAGGTENGTSSLANRFTIGGFLHISGLHPDQKSGQHLRLIQAAYYRRFGNIKFLPVYVGGSLEYGGTWIQKDDIGTDTSILGGSLFLGLDSPIGPVLFGMGYTDEGDSTVFTKVGRFF